MRSSLLLPFVIAFGYSCAIILIFTIKDSSWGNSMARVLRRQNFSASSTSELTRLSWMKNSTLMSKSFRKELEIAEMTAKDKSIDYEGMTPKQRGKFQQAQVEKFCRIYMYGRGNNVKKILPRQMLVNDKSRMTYCYVPKAGCTTLKTLFFFTLDALPESILKNRSKSPEEGYLEQAISQHSFKAKNETQIKYITQHYHKYLMYRNPVERVVSAYLSKIVDIPLVGLETNVPERNWLRLKIFNSTHPKEFRKWKREGATTPVIIAFPDFIKYWLANGGIYFDEHFKKIFDLCRPCQIRYDYYGNFKNFNKEIGIFTDRIKGNSSHVMKVKRRKQGTTNDVSPKYYSQISYKQKIKIIEILAIDLSFYYTLFPAEKGVHKTIMGVDYDVPSVS